METLHKKVAIMAAISAGLSLGFAKFTWHPSKILWGFGAFAVVVGGPVWSFAPMLVAAFVLAAFVISTLGVWVWRWFCGMVSKAEAVAIMRSAGADDELAGGLTEVE